MKLHFLGTASGLPTADRFSQTTVLELDPRTLYLLDVGDGASGFLFRHGLEHDAVRGVIISHMHGDHYCGIIQLLKTMMHLGRSAPLSIYLPLEGIAPLQAMLTASYLIPEFFGYEITWTPIDASESVDLSPVDDDRELIVRAVVNAHLDHYRKRAETISRPLPWRYESYSFHIAVGGLSLAYSGNLDRDLAEMDPEFRGVDVLISELAHLRPPECREALGRLRPRRAIFAHFHRVWDDRGNWDEGGLSRLAEGLSGVDVSVAQDGDVIRL